MKQLLLILMMTLGLFAEVEFVDSYKEALELAHEENKLVMLMFSMQECPACKHMKEKVYTDERVSDYMDAYFISYEIDILEEELEGFRVYATPTYYFLRKDGSQIGKPFVGGASAEAFLQILKERR
jgi:thioredoxin-related protein